MGIRYDFQREILGEGKKRGRDDRRRVASCNFSSLIRESSSLRAISQRKNGGGGGERGGGTGLIKLITIIHKVLA